MVWYMVLLTAALSYLIGSFQTSYIFGKAIKKKDIREYGSGNPGATNAMRVFGFKFGMVVLLIDALKGALTIVLVKYGFGCTDTALLLLAGIFCIVGHNFPFYMGFKGGKGVAASLGIILVVDYKVFLFAGILALISLFAFRIMSIASLVFEFNTLLGFFLLYMTNNNFFWIIVTAAVYPLMSFYRHRRNLKNLVDGKEKKLWGEGSEHIIPY